MRNVNTQKQVVTSENILHCQKMPQTSPPEGSKLIPLQV